MSVSFEVTQRFTDLLVREAWARDNSRFDEWVAFFDDELRYWAPSRLFLERGQENLGKAELFCHIDEDKPGFLLRIKRLTSGLTYTDEPPPRTRRLITNVLVLEADDSNAEVISYFMMFRSHPGHPDESIVGHRRDKWVRRGADWRIRERMIVIDQDKLTSYLGLL
ncbi:MAG TPA: aromatic-ring-hydroxylating dioxygenase subunit beta [Stellaceae bacterium]|nr:aromatic-ring-hydroxylating dioxygenase subunit beta [Stellaceae bacterium]